jgi:hypothetical protein
VPEILRSRVALLGLMGAFLIPIGMSSLRGIAHVLTCKEQVNTPFTLLVEDNKAPEAVTSTIFDRQDMGGVCGGLDVNLGARRRGPDQMAMVVPISNDSGYPWKGTVKLVLDGTSIPVNIGEIPDGQERTDVVPFRLDPGSHAVDGSLLIGP